MNNLVTLEKYIDEHKYKFGAELGVRRGDTTEYLCSRFPDLYMYAVDLWPSDGSEGVGSLPGEEYSSNAKNYETALEKFKPYKERIKVIRKHTLQAASSIADNSLDFVFIDATHTYDGVKKNIKAWLSKIKDTGLLCGHDYHSFFDNGGHVRAINELGPVVVDDFTLWFILKKDIRSDYEK